MQLIKSFLGRRAVFAAATSFIIVGGLFISVPFSANATITTINLDVPDGGEEWRGTQSIDWSGVSDNTADKVDITFASDGINFNEIIATNLLFSDGSYSWNTLLPDPDTLTARIRISPSGFPLVFDTSTNVFAVDNTDPVTTLTIEPIDGINGWYITVPAMSLSCADTGGTGCNKTYYRWDGGVWVDNSVTPVAASEGSHLLEYYSDDQAVDALGARNEETIQSLTVKVDITDPTVAVTSTTADGAYNVPDEINVTLTFSEAITTTDTITVTLETGATDRTCIVPIMSNTAVGTCTYTVQAGDTSGDLTTNSIVATTGTVLDIAGNVANLAPTSNLAATSALVIDTTVPAAFTTGAVTVTGGTVVATWWNSTNTGANVVVPVANDASLTDGIIQIQAEADGTFENVGSAYTVLVGDLSTNKTISLTAVQLEAIAGFSEGDVITFRAVITDLAGNPTTGANSADTETVDQIAPAVDAGTDKEVNATASQDATTSDGGSGLATHQWAKITGTGTITFGTPTTVDTTIAASAEDSFGISLTVTDTAGNSASDSIVFVWDISPPQLTEMTVVPTPTNDNTPSWTFGVDFVSFIFPGGGISYTGSCGIGNLTTAVAGPNTTTFPTLADGTYADCAVTVTDAAGNTSSALTATSFEVDTITAFVSTITTTDANLDGMVDTATIVFTDEIKDSTFSAGTFSIGGVAATTFTTGTANDNTVVLSHAGVAGTNAKTVSYTPGTATDLAGNTLGAISQTSTDAAKPVLLSARTITTTSVEAMFSEDLNGTTVNVGGNEFTVAGVLATAAVEHISDDGRVVLTVATMGTGDEPTVKYQQVDTLADSTGNTAVTPTTVTAVDGVAPVLTVIHIATSNTNALYAKTGDTVTLTFTSSETISTPTVLIQGVAATVDAPVGNNWTAHRVMTGTDTEGSVTFSIVYADDASPTPNSGVTETAVDDASSVLFDRTNPSVDAGTTPKYINIAVTSISQDATVTDGGSGVNTAEYLWTQFSGTGTATPTPNNTEDTVLTADTDGAYVMQLYGEDKAGNSATDTMTLIRDTVSPFVKTYSPTTGKINVPITEGGATVTFNENIGVLDTSGISIVNDDTDVSMANEIPSVNGGNDASAVLDLPYGELETGTTYRFNVNPQAVRDTAGNPFTFSFANHFTTVADEAAPVVESFTAGSITTTGAVLSATTDEGATCRYSDVDEVFGSMTLFTTTGTAEHEVTLAGLTPATTYDYYTRCVDTSPAANVMTTSAHVSFTTAPDVDATPPTAPVITTANADIDADTYTIAGTEAADGGVRTLRLYNGATLVATLSLPAGQTTWSTGVSLTQTSANVFTATASDETGNTSVSSNTVTITEATATGDTDLPPAPVISGSDETVDADTYNLSGTAGADTPSDGTRTITVYNNGTVVGSLSLPAGQTDWSFVSPLSQGTANSFTAYSTDTASNVSSVSNTRLITEQQSDTTAPTIVSSDPADTDTDVSVDVAPQVSFDEPLDSTTVTNSSVQLLDSANAPVAATVTLANGNTTAIITPDSSLGYLADYHIAVTATVTDAAGNSFAGTTNYATFTTEDVPADVTAPVITNIRTTAPIGATSVTITWDTDENADSQVEYGTDLSYGNSTTVDSTMTMAHSVTITGLSADTIYHFRVVSADPNTNSATSADNVFQTDIDDSTAALAVTGIDAVDTFATDTDDFADGWSWTFHITVPTGETEFAMKFADFTSGAETIFAADNIRYYTAQSTEADTIAEAVTIAGANTYQGNITLDSDADANTAGIQIEVTVEMKVPVESAGGSYSAQYGVSSVTGTP